MVVSTTGDAGSMVIPEDLLMEILKRLPVKSLCRFRCVSTLWRSIISDPRFVDSHFAHSANHPKLLISLPSQPDPAPQGRWFFTANQSEPGNLQSQTALPYFFAPGTAHRYVSQSLNGLICFQVCGDVGVCNPTTGKYVTLTTIREKITGDYAYPHYSFGFDPVDKKHKVLSTLATSRRSMPDLPWVIMEHHVLDLGSNKWRRIEDGAPHLKKESEICFNGLIYYRAWNGNIANPREDYLVEFNVGTESFRMVKFPGNDGPRGGHGKICLIEFEGRIAVADLRHVKRDGSDDFVLLISEDFEREIWRKKVIAFPPGWKKILAAEEVFLAGTVGTGELLFASQIMSKPQRVFYYNPKTNSFRCIEINGLPEYKKLLPPAVWQMFTHHVESLLPLNGVHDRQLHLT
ncbi:Importin N-terminal domain-containing protein [Psidium guajava]|nr:Importin N-terminal domain-containing protein [Psidium guajava]